MIDNDDTIVAIASPTSPAVRGIVRLSGPDVAAVLRGLGIAAIQTRPHRQSTSIDLGEPIGHVHADVMIWPTTRSYTGQPSAEIHTHGSLPVLTRLVHLATGTGARGAAG